MKKGKQAFTLVELIVVITILAILATIGFVSFSGYLAGTRDTNRVAQLKSMSDALELYRTKKDLPIPDDKIDIKADGDIISYQGYIGKNVLETIEYTESGLDPKDKEYFSYYLTKNKKYFQLMAFLEEPNDDIVIGVNATDYSDRYPFVKGKKLGILTDLNNNPIQEVEVIIGSGSIDTKTATGYLANIDNGKQLIGREISGLKEIVKIGGIEQNLVAWYDFETINGTGFLDLSGHHYTGEIFGSPTVFDGRIGKGLRFDGTISQYIILPNETLNGLKDFSILGWMNVENYTTYNRHLLDVWSIDEHDLIGMNLGKGGIDEIGIGISINDIDGESFLYDINSKEKNIWYHLGLVKNGNTMILYVNGKNIKEISSDAIGNINMNVLGGGIVIGQEQDGSSPYSNFNSNQSMLGKLDDLRIYEGIMNEGRIEKIYKLGN